MANLKQTYHQELAPALRKQLELDNVMKTPKLLKVSLNMGVGEAVNDKKIMTNALADMTQIAGQKAVVTKSRKSVAGFKIRDGWPIGCRVTLRGERMYDFIERLVNVVLPRVRDFRGLSPKSFDGMGNYNFGLKEQIVFPEIDYDQVDALRGMNITIATSATDDASAKALLVALGFPFRDSKARNN
jgi:large subunit ribosomal protein L5